MITRTQVECFYCQEWFTIYGEVFPTGWIVLEKLGIENSKFGFCSYNCAAHILKKWGYPNVNTVIEDPKES